jgi:thymidine kinase
MNIENPKFIVYTGPMFGAKTSRLLMTLERYKYQRKNIMLFKPLLDDRYSCEDVVTHSGWRMSAKTIKTGADVLEILANENIHPSVIAVDEAFMIPGIADALIWLYRSGFTVIVSTLDLSATGQVFKEVEKMLPWATQVEKCSAICTICGKEAFYTHKKQLSGNEIEIGGDELYEPRCLSHHLSILLYRDA